MVKSRMIYDHTLFILKKIKKLLTNIFDRCRIYYIKQLLNKKERVLYVEKIKKLPESELEIMLIAWEKGSEVTSDYIMERIDKSWGKTTLLNLLTRLCKRGFMECRKEGKINIYTPIVSKEEYVQSESKSFFEKLYHNSLTGLVAALYDGKSITKEDLEELKRYIEEEGNA